MGHFRCYNSGDIIAVTGHFFSNFLDGIFDHLSCLRLIWIFDFEISFEFSDSTSGRSLLACLNGSSSGTSDAPKILSQKPVIQSSRFIRALNSCLAQAIGKIHKLAGKLFELRPFTRILSWGRDYRNAIRYLKINQQESRGKFDETKGRKNTVFFFKHLVRPSKAGSGHRVGETGNRSHSSSHRKRLALPIVWALPSKNRRLEAQSSTRV